MALFFKVSMHFETPLSMSSASPCRNLRGTLNPLRSPAPRLSEFSGRWAPAFPAQGFLHSFVGYLASQAPSLPVNAAFFAARSLSVEWFRAFGFVGFQGFRVVEFSGAFGALGFLGPGVLRFAV